MVQNTQTNSLGSLMEENTTLTPTTAKLVTQLFESEDCLNKLQTIESDGFVVPLPPAPITATKSSRKSFSKLDSSSWQGGTTTVVTPTKSETLTLLDIAPVNMAIQTRSSSRATRATAVVQPQRQIVASRKHAVIKRTPPKSRPGVKAMKDESALSPEESERLRVRRERNKAAAARCRKRRLDQISTLSDEVSEHEDKKRMLEHTIAQLKAQKEELEYILNQHQTECHFNPSTVCLPAAAAAEFPVVAVKSEPVLVQSIDQMYHVVEKPTLPSIQNHRNQQGAKPKRPLFLNISSPNPPTSVAGITIDTPSNVVGGLSFETLMTSTGLTPTSNIVTPISFNVCTSNAPSCSSQQRTSELSLTDLNTPCNENMSLVSL